MAQGLSNGCAGLLAFPCVFLHALTLHNTGTNQKKAKTDNLLGIKLWSSHQNMINHLRHNDKSLFAKKLVQGDPWTSALPKEGMNGEEVWQMHRLKHILIHTAK